jgi:hypothetical protein
MQALDQSPPEGGVLAIDFHPHIPIIRIIASERLDALNPSGGEPGIKQAACNPYQIGLEDPCSHIF